MLNRYFVSLNSSINSINVRGLAGGPTLEDKDTGGAAGATRPVRITGSKGARTNLRGRGGVLAERFVGGGGARPGKRGGTLMGGLGADDGCAGDDGAAGAEGGARDGITRGLGAAEGGGGGARGGTRSAVGCGLYTNVP